jgi:hypothetical protein
VIPDSVETDSSTPVKSVKCQQIALINQEWPKVASVAPAHIRLLAVVEVNPLVINKIIILGIALLIIGGCSMSTPKNPHMTLQEQAIEKSDETTGTQHKQVYEFDQYCKIVITENTYAQLLKDSLGFVEANPQKISLLELREDESKKEVHIHYLLNENNLETEVKIKVKRCEDEGVTAMIFCPKVWFSAHKEIIDAMMYSLEC